MIARRCYVSGRVQGVFYRASARQRADTLGLTGYARNLADGRVEVLACGDPAAVAAFCAWLWEGSPAATVTEVLVEELDAAALEAWPTEFASG